MVYKIKDKKNFRFFFLVCQTDITITYEKWTIFRRLQSSYDIQNQRSKHLWEFSLDLQTYYCNLREIFKVTYVSNFFRLLSDLWEQNLSFAINLWYTKAKHLWYFFFSWQTYNYMLYSHRKKIDDNFLLLSKSWYWDVPGNYRFNVWADNVKFIAAIQSWKN